MSKRLLITILAAVFSLAGLLSSPPIAVRAAFNQYSISTTWFDGARPITQSYGCSSDSSEVSDARFICDSPYRVHEGVDIGYPNDCYSTNYAVKAAMSGTVWRGSDQWLGSSYPILQTDADGVFIRMGHTRKLLTSDGQHVAAGATIAYVGSEGISTGCHIHFEVDTSKAVATTSVSPYGYLFGASPSASIMTNRWGRNITLLPGSGGVATQDTVVWVSTGWHGWSDAVDSAIDFDLAGGATTTIYLVYDPNGYSWHDELDQVGGTRYHHWMRLCQRSGGGCATRESYFDLSSGNQNYNWTGDLS